MTATDKNPSYLENMIVAIENAIMAIPDFEGPMPDELWELLQAAHKDGRRDKVKNSTMSSPTDKVYCDSCRFLHYESGNCTATRSIRVIDTPRRRRSTIAGIVPCWERNRDNDCERFEKGVFMWNLIRSNPVAYLSIAVGILALLLGLHF